MYDTQLLPTAEEAEGEGESDSEAEAEAEAEADEVELEELPEQPSDNIHLQFDSAVPKPELATRRTA